MQSAKLWCSSVKDSLLSFIYPTPEDNEVTFDAALSSPTVVCLNESDFISNANTKSSFDSSNKSQPIHPDQTSQLLPDKYLLQTYPASEEKEPSFDSSFDSSNESLPIHSDQTSQVLSEKPVLKSCIRCTASAPTIDLSSTELKPSSSQSISSSAISAPAIALPSPELGSSSSQSICSSSASGKKILFRFSEDVVVYETYNSEEYSRKAVKPLYFSPKEFIEVEEEICHFKLHEMKVHPDSVNNISLLI
ncbi:hypothetical protein DSO57_1031332 [Entomophthora muscae]|uniref:Uncharacterized protein n=1 Tax=Entomophthora muscae TaxID=34485 RepID=A0ACC2TBK5_9FUNG|nr:hypothetical protein DSO57_1031332 [Entomophthora muscae]